MSLSTADIMALPDTPQKRAMLAQLGRAPVAAAGGVTRPKPRMNKAEQAYARVLEAMKFNGEIAGFAFEGDTLLLALDLRYRPDFLVWLPDGRIEYHEVKGFLRDDARDKFKMAAELRPYARFLMVRKAKGETWETLRDIPARVPAMEAPR